MDRVDLNVLRCRLPEYVEMVTKPSRSGNRCCPVCGSGTGRNHTGAFKVFPDNRWYCFSCGSRGDIFDLISLVEGCSLQEAVMRAANRFDGIEPREGNSTPVRENPFSQPIRKDYTPYILGTCCTAWEQKEARNYLLDRGIEKQAMERFMLRYDSDRHLLIIPYSRECTYYMGRSVREKRFFKPPADEAGREPVYNAAALRTQQPVFVTEGPIDAISLMTAGDCSAVAIGGTGSRKLLDCLDAGGIRPRIIISLDNDDAGKRESSRLAAALEERGLQYIIAEYSSREFKDANDMLAGDRRLLACDIQKNIKKIEEKGNIYV